MLNTPTSKTNFAVLKLAINTDNNELLELYRNHINTHNNKLKTNSLPDSGFDIFVPKETLFKKLFKTYMIDMEIKTEMVFYEAATDTIQTCAYMIFARSSLSKTPLILSNHVGIMDAGYRGSVLGAFRCLELPDGHDTYTVEKNTRLIQICHPSLCPIYVEIVDENQLSVTSRGSGGFGSTGTVGIIG